MFLNSLKSALRHSLEIHFCVTRSFFQDFYRYLQQINDSGLSLQFVGLWDKLRVVGCGVAPVPASVSGPLTNVEMSVARLASG